jgi:hypothetical protein
VVVSRNERGPEVRAEAPRARRSQPAVVVEIRASSARPRRSTPTSSAPCRRAPRTSRAGETLDGR